MLLGSTSDPAPARAKVVEVAGLRLTTPPGWQLADPGSGGRLAVRSGGDSPARLDVRLTEGPHEPPPSAEAVQLGRLQAWRTAAPGVLRYSAPTSGGTLLISCRTSAAADSPLLRDCERTASTVTLRGATALPLRDAVDREDRLRATVAALRAQRDAGRGRLARATRRSGQSAVARSLARSHKRAAAALADIPGADPIATAARATATAYAALAKAAASGKRDRWQRAREGVDRQDATLADALAAAG
jgi:hypothetical protein